jgi:homoserine O-acetyltransferase
MIASSCLFRSLVTGAAIGFAMLWGPFVFAGAPSPIPASSGPHPEHLVANLGDFKFESGEVLKDFKVSYVTHGKLNKAKSNVILAMQFFGGDHHGYDFLIGPGKALDTDKYFIIATDFIGNSVIRQDVTTGPTNSGLKMEFPAYNVRDSVNVEYKLLKEYLGFDHVLAVIGASIGAMKSYQFALSYPTYMTAAIPIAGAAATNPKTRWVLNNMMDIIALDSGWNGGNYETNPAAGVQVAFAEFAGYLYTDRFFSQNVRTPEQRRAFRKFWHDLLSVQVPEDARDIYSQLRMWADYNLGDTPGFGGDTQAVLRTIKARVLLISMKEDLLFSNEDIALVKNSIPNVTHVEVDSLYGHLACIGADPEATKVMDREIARFLAKLK